MGAANLKLMGAAELNLTPDEIRLIHAYRKTCDETQDTLVRLTEMYAQNPMLKRPIPPKPAFQVVSSDTNWRPAHV